MQQAQALTRHRPIRDWPLPAQYALAIGLTIAAVLLDKFLNPLIDDGVSFVTVFGTLLPLALLVRPGPFLVAAFLGTVGSLFLILPPAYSIAWAGRPAGIEFDVFVVAMGAATFTAFISDRHQRRQRQDLLKREQALQTLIDGTSFMLTRCSRDLRYLFVSQAYASMLGRTPADIAGKPIAEVMGQKASAPSCRTSSASWPARLRTMSARPFCRRRHAIVIRRL